MLTTMEAAYSQAQKRTPAQNCTCGTSHKKRRTLTHMLAADTHPKNDTACNSNLVPSLFVSYGYGKYCGLGMLSYLNILPSQQRVLNTAIPPSGYGCQSLEEPGCDPIDDCCKIHDACVNSYCASCLCNIRLVRCLQYLNTTTGFEPCKFPMP